MAGRKIELLKDTVPPPPREASSPALKYEPGATSMELWRNVLAHYDDDELHRAFIRACFTEGKLRFALDCYRTLEKLRPGDPVAARYLAQVAKTMELGAIGSTSNIQLEVNDRLLKRPLRILWMLVLGLCAMLLLYGVAQAIRVVNH